MSTSWGTPLADKMNPTNRKCTPPVKWGASKISGIIIRVLCQQKGHHQKVMSFLLVEETKGDSNPLKSNMPVACWQNQCEHWFSPYRFPQESGPSNPPSPTKNPQVLKEAWGFLLIHYSFCLHEIEQAIMGKLPLIITFCISLAHCASYFTYSRWHGGIIRI